MKHLPFYLLLITHPLLAEEKKTEKKNWTTYWNIRRPLPNDPLDIEPASRIPEDYRKFRWLVFDGNKNNKNKSSEPVNIPIFSFDPIALKLTPKGSVPVGKEITLEKVTPLNHIVYYGFPVSKLDKPESERTASDYAFISGIYIKINGYKE